MAEEVRDYSTSADSKIIQDGSVIDLETGEIDDFELDVLLAEIGTIETVEGIVEFWEKNVKPALRSGEITPIDRRAVDVAVLKRKDELEAAIEASNAGTDNRLEVGPDKIELNDDDINIDLKKAEIDGEAFEKERAAADRIQTSIELDKYRYLNNERIENQYDKATADFIKAYLQEIFENLKHSEENPE